MKTRTSIGICVATFAAATLPACGNSDTTPQQPAAGSGGQDAATDVSTAGSGATGGTGVAGGAGGNGGVAGEGGAKATGGAGGKAGNGGTAGSQGECQPPCNPAQCQMCVHQACESLCHGTEVCSGGICQEPICDPPCDRNAAICADSVCETFSALKNKYMAAHPGQAIVPFPWEPSTSTRVLPFNYEIPAAPGNVVSISACRGQFEAASFVLTALKDLSGITIAVPDLKDAQGNTIPSSDIDVRLVKVWHQAAADNIEYTTTGSSPSYPAVGYPLTPELLLKEDRLVNVDYANKLNYLNVTISGVQQYIDISSPSATVPTTAEIHDAVTLQPFSLKANENKQIWMTARVPTTTPAGNYSGSITINASSETPVTMTLNVTVLPFDLEPAPVEYAIYYLGVVTYDPLIIGDYRKTEALYAIELEDMKNHGVLYPTLSPGYDPYVEAALAIRDTAGLPKDKIYVLDTEPGQSAYIGNAADAAGLAAIAARVLNWKSITQAHGYAASYFYGMDEAKGDLLLSQRLAWQTVHDNGGKVYVACTLGAADGVGDLLDAPVLYGNHTATEISAEIAKFHGHGQHVSTYGNPQVGIENPAIYRRNYGLALWNAEYDGAMDFAYQAGFGPSIWNDYDHPGWVEDGIRYHYRDHVFAYPTTDGVIDTIQWEGWREGVDDTRYLATLVSKMKNDTLARSIVVDSLSKNESMSMIRKRLIKEILSD
jgi:hypothetical protein